jgi:hypothetical protein
MARPYLDQRDLGSADQLASQLAEPLNSLDQPKRPLEQDTQFPIFPAELLTPKHPLGDLAKHKSPML